MIVYTSKLSEPSITTPTYYASRTKICGLTERDYGPIRAIMLFLWRELSKTKRDKDFVSLV